MISWLNSPVDSLMLYTSRCASFLVLKVLRIKELPGERAITLINAHPLHPPLHFISLYTRTKAYPRLLRHISLGEASPRDESAQMHRTSLKIISDPPWARPINKDDDAIMTS